MDQIVVDSSIVIKWFTTEPYSAEARQVLDSYRNGQISLSVPDLLFAEVGNIVWKKQRWQHLLPADANAIIDVLFSLTFYVVSSAELVCEAYRLACMHDRTVYDCLYLALSVREGCLFVTADERLANAVHGAMPNVIWIGDWTIEAV